MITHFEVLFKKELSDGFQEFETMNLKEKLISEHKTRWLDVGCGGNFEEGFFYLDTFPEEILDPKFKDRYFRIDILNCSQQELESLGKFDLIRMQHTFEHFSYEEGQRVSLVCAKILKKEGIILITVPDLKVHIKKYTNNKYSKGDKFKEWANKRIPENAPSSFYFSVFAYSMPYESHKWCYDYEGLKYQLELSKKYKNIKEIKFSDPLANYPFTHNRPEEDVCIIASKK